MILPLYKLVTAGRSRSSVKKTSQNRYPLAQMKLSHCGDSSVGNYNCSIPPLEHSTTWSSFTSLLGLITPPLPLPSTSISFASLRRRRTLHLWHRRDLSGFIALRALEGLARQSPVSWR